MYNSKMKTIFNQKLAGHLMTLGFVLVNMQPNKNRNGKNVFYFNDSPELCEAIEKYTRKA